MAAMALSLGITQLPVQAWAQDSDDDAHVIGNDSHRSQPGVVARETPNDGAAQADAPAETADSEAPAAGGGGMARL